MTPDIPRRRAMIAYVAGVAVIAGLMTFVALSGGGITARKSAIEIASPHITAMKQH